VGPGIPIECLGHKAGMVTQQPPRRLTRPGRA
jgi:hypothetical protein